MHQQPQSPKPFSWETSSPSDLGLNPKAVANYQELCAKTGADACLVIGRNTIAMEWYAERYQAPTYAMSSTKSVTSMLVGMLLDEGKIDSLDMRVGEFLPSWNDSRRKKVTLRHLLTHSSGLATPKSESVGWAPDKNAHVLALQPDYEPGTRFHYSNEGVQLLSPIIDLAAGEPAQDYARRRLFSVLGMSETHLNVDSAGHAWTYADMQTTPRDFARLGLLMLKMGNWQGQQILSEQYVACATSPCPTNQEYGLLWWLYAESKTLAGYAARGYLDTNLHVFPEAQIVVVRMQAPKDGFTADPESGDYMAKALELFRHLPAGA